MKDGPKAQNSTAEEQRTHPRTLARFMGNTRDGSSVVGCHCKYEVALQPGKAGSKQEQGTCSRRKLGLSGVGPDQNLAVVPPSAQT